MSAFSRPIPPVLIILIGVTLLIAMVTVNALLFLSPQYTKYQYSRLEMDKNSELFSDALPIIRYLKNEQIELDKLSPKEANHLADVRSVFDLTRSASIAASLFVVIALAWIKRKRSWREFWQAVSVSTAFAIAFTSIFLVAVYFNFTWIFDRFHQLLFTPDTWTFSANTTLMRLFPQEFWAQAAGDLALLTLLEMGLLGVGSSLAARFTSN